MKKNLEENSRLEKSSSKSSQRRKDDSLICSICEAPAHGYNFDAITCESCKAFFRRNALKGKVKQNGRDFFLKTKFFSLGKIQMSRKRRTL